MRVVKPSEKIAEKHPDRLATIYGQFFAADGKTKLSITSKNLTRADVLNPDTVIDLDNGTLILPAGERGRKPSVSATQSEVTSLLNSVREAAQN